jgi:hypothetical protein
MRAYWTVRHGTWRLCLLIQPEITAENWLTGLSRYLGAKARRQALELADDLTIPIPQFRAALLQAVASAMPDERSGVDFLASFGSDAIESEVNGKRTGEIADTALRTMSGAGHQHFLGVMKSLVSDTKQEHLEKALLLPWHYDDPVENHTMRWDPIDDVRYALRWRNSSGDPSRKRAGSLWGANRLALEALPLLPTAPVGGRLETTGFSQQKGHGVLWTWPIWTVAVGVDVVRSLLSLTDLQEPRPDRERLSAIGVSEVYRCQRITQGKYRNFTPAEPV